jgi:DNA repair protein RecN (Recombination protein N)
MLKSLHIENYVLIDRLDIEFRDGFSVVTGETGAGKSIILGALSLILGQRADSKAIKENAQKCIIEGSFRVTDYHLESFFAGNDLDYEEACIIRREIHANGKSRSFINDTPVSLQVMKDLGEQLIDIHSQHQNLLLTRAAFQLEVVDAVAKNSTCLQQYQERFRAYKSCVASLAELREKSVRQQEEKDYLLFQFTQLDQAGIEAGEQDALEHELNTLTHAGEIKAELLKTGQLLNDETSAIPLLRDAVSALKRAERMYPDAGEWLQRLDSCTIELKDIAAEIERANETIDVDPERAETIRQRLDLLYTLEQKHHVATPAELIGLRDHIGAQLQEIDSLDEAIGAKEQETAHALQLAADAAKTVTDNRKSTLPQIEQALESQLRKLGMPDVRFVVGMAERTDWNLYGKDDIEFRFSANKNLSPQPVAQIASGGEISRVMLSIKSLIANATSLPTIIFDEIDTGISGEIADAMSVIMKQMGSVMQVIAITHLPQIASKGAAHYKVFKDTGGNDISTAIRLLTEEERIKEIASMLSGASITVAALENARELLSAN